MLLHTLHAELRWRADRSCSSTTSQPSDTDECGMSAWMYRVQAVENQMRKEKIVSVAVRLAGQFTD